MGKMLDNDFSKEMGERKKAVSGEIALFCSRGRNLMRRWHYLNGKVICNTIGLAGRPPFGTGE